MAYDNAGNSKKSNTIDITRNTNFWKGFEIIRKDQDANIDKNNTLILFSGGGWRDTYVFLKSPKNLHEYSKISVTYSYEPGYTYGFGVWDIDEKTRIILSGSDGNVSENISTKTETFDIPKSCDSHGIWFRAGSMLAYLYIYNVELIK